MAKHKGNTGEYTEQRNKELNLAYKEAANLLLKKHGHLDVIKAVDLARQMPTTRFFINEDTASKIIKKMMSGIRPIKSMDKGKGVMYNLLYDTYMLFKNMYPRRQHDDIVAEICASPAPEFFLSTKSAYQIISRYRRKLKNQVK